MGYLGPDLVSNIKGFTISSVKQVGLNLLTPKVRDIPLEYLVMISAQTEGMSVPMGIEAKLQAPIEMHLGSRWEYLLDGLPMQGLVKLVDLGLQTFAGHSLQNAVTSRRIWRGTDPLDIKLKLAFYENTDVRVDVMDRIAFLQKLCLPAIGVGKFMMPPGPTPAYEIKPGETIVVRVGRMLVFNRVIVKTVDVRLDNRLSNTPNKGIPIAAEVDIVFSTYEMISKDGLDEIYKVQFEQSGQQDKAKTVNSTTGPKK